MKVKYSALMSDARGKLNGSVASKNRYGQYFRNKITPSNPQTAAQVNQRAKLATFSAGWRSLSEDARVAWNGAVSNWTGTNIFGDVVTPSGNVLYNRLNMTLATIGESPIALPPLPLGAESPVSVLATATAGTPSMEVTVDPASTPANHQLVIEATAPLSPGIYNANNKFRIVAINPSLTIGVADIISEYTDKFGAPIAGMKVHFKVSYYREGTGEKSQSLKTSTIVAA